MIDSKSDLAIHVRDLEFRWGRKPVLRGIDLDVRWGEVLALVGDNGAGKSTLLELLSGSEPYRGRLRRPKATVRVLGLDPVRHGAQVRSRVGYVQERVDLPRWMRIRDHFRLLQALYPSWSEASATRWLAAFGLDPSARYSELSKGKRALENLAAALAQEPELLLLDEPFSGLDARARRIVTEGLIEFLCAGEKSVLLVSHSLADIERCADRVALLEDGRVGRTATTEEWRGLTASGALEDGILSEAPLCKAPASEEVAA